MNLSYVLLVGCVFFGVLQGDVEEHFKPISSERGSHGMRNIDFIYMINLDKRPEKYESCIKQLAPYGIHPFRFSAVNGWELSLEDINDIGVTFAPWITGGKWGTYYPLDGDGTPQHEIIQTLGRTYFSHCMSRGAIGIVLSHCSILQDAYDAGYETIWVMEDDIEIVRDPHILSGLIDQLDALVGKSGWDILFTDQDTKNNDGAYVPCSSYAWRPNYTPAHPGKFAEKVDISADLRRIGSRYGAYSMIVRRSGMKKILNFIKALQVFLPYDMEFTLPADMRLFSVTNDVVSTQIKAFSDNGAPNYKNRK